MSSERLLRLLSLLQTRREWSGPELCERLSVSPRTVRRDIERLRGLGYPVHATLGAAGGYVLEAGAAMPPLLLDDEEAVAIAVGLRAATGGAVEGIAEASVRALAKLEQVLPARLRRRVTALHAATTTLGPPYISCNRAYTIGDRKCLFCSGESKSSGDDDLRRYCERKKKGRKAQRT